MLKVKRTNHRSAPAFCCDICGQPIEEISLGAALYTSTSQEGEEAKVLIVHKPTAEYLLKGVDCWAKAEKELLELESLQALAAGRPEPQYVPWQELSHYLAKALRNGHFDEQSFQQIDIQDAILTDAGPR